MANEDRLNALRARIKSQQPKPGYEGVPVTGSESLKFDVPEMRPVMTGFNRQGPQYQIFDPVQKMVEEGAKPSIEAMGSLGTVQALFQDANSKIPAIQDPSQAAIGGITRQFGRSTPGRILGMANEPARAFNSTKQTFLGELARGLSQERGVLTNQDIQRIEASLPSEDDSIYTRTEKEKFITDLISKRIARYNRLAGMMGQRGRRTLEI